MREMAKYPQEFEQLLVHTGQHYDDNMSKVFFEDLKLPQPNIYLGVGRGALRQAQNKRSRRKGIGLTYPWIEAQVEKLRIANCGLLI